MMEFEFPELGVYWNIVGIIFIVATICFVMALFAGKASTWEDTVGVLGLMLMALGVVSAIVVAVITGMQQKELNSHMEVQGLTSIEYASESGNTFFAYKDGKTVRCNINHDYKPGLVQVSCKD